MLTGPWRRTLATQSGTLLKATTSPRSTLEAQSAAWQAVTSGTTITVVWRRTLAMVEECWWGFDVGPWRVTRTATSSPADSAQSFIKATDLPKTEKTANRFAIAGSLPPTPVTPCLRVSVHYIKHLSHFSHRRDLFRRAGPLVPSLSVASGQRSWLRSPSQPRPRERRGRSDCAMRQVP